MKQSAVVMNNNNHNGAQTISVNIDHLEQNHIETPSGSGAVAMGKKRQASGLDDDSKNDNDDIFLNKKNIIRLQKKTKTYSYVTPQQYLTSPHKPRINDDDVALLQSAFDIVLSQYHAAQSSPSSMKVYKENMSQQNANKNLKDAPGTFIFLKEALNQPLDDLPRYLWTNGYHCTGDEQQNNDMIRHILTDFRINCMIIATKPSNERTPFAEHFVPIFKAFAGITNLVAFTWCEKGLQTNHLLSLCLPESTPLRSLLDGVGTSIKDNMERILIESSGDDSEHATEDTLKQMSNTSNCLKMEMKKYKLASYDTFLKRQIFGIHFIHDKMTLTSTRMESPNRYSFIEVRSATIPTKYEQRCDWIKVFELLLKLKASLIEQEKLTSLLEEQRVGLEDVALTVENAMD
ncbi:unnamed protein product [Absidia cylindrospora]